MLIKNLFTEIISSVLFNCSYCWISTKFGRLILATFETKFFEKLGKPY